MARGIIHVKYYLFECLDHADRQTDPTSRFRTFIAHHPFWVVTVYLPCSVSLISQDKTVYWSAYLAGGFWTNSIPLEMLPLRPS